MSYFPALLFLGAFSGGSCFGGLPLPGTLRIASNADSSYIAACPTYPFGFIPATLSRIFAAGAPIPRACAISATDSPFITIISEAYRKNIKKSIEIVKIYSKNKEKHLTKSIGSDIFNT
jgi:hypothetical protein